MYGVSVEVSEKEGRRFVEFSCARKCYLSTEEFLNYT
jgi:hypothetical protein